MQWLKTNEDKIVGFSGLLAATYKGIEDSRENQINWKAQEQLNHTQKELNMLLMSRLDQLEAAVGIEKSKNGQLEIENQQLQQTNNDLCKKIEELESKIAARDKTADSTYKFVLNLFKNER